MNKDNILVRDINQNYVVINRSELFKELVEESNTTIFGMTLNTIRELQFEYQRRNGPMPMTPESVALTFRGGE